MPDSPRYNIQMKSKVGTGLFGGNRFTSMYAKSDDDIKTFKDSIMPLLANSQHIGITKVVENLGDFTLASDFKATDAYAWRITVKGAVSRYTIDVALRPDVSIDTFCNFVKSYLCDVDGSALSVVGYKMVGSNIVKAGPVDPPHSQNV